MARLLTLEEVLAAPSVWLEVPFIGHAMPREEIEPWGEWLLLRYYSAREYRWRKSYGARWRCWDKCPTSEEMEAAPWLPWMRDEYPVHPGRYPKTDAPYEYTAKAEARAAGLGLEPRAEGTVAMLGHEPLRGAVGQAWMERGYVRERADWTPDPFDLDSLIAMEGRA